MAPSGYDEDLVLWADNQARALRDASRASVNLPIDWQHIAEEIEALGKSQSRELASRISVILEHLMKLEASPAVHPHAGWHATIQRRRDAIEQLLDDSPSLRPAVPAVVAGMLARARRIAALELADFSETPSLSLEDLTYSADQVLGDWFPSRH